jgi:hypothetical protein
MTHEGHVINGRWVFRNVACSDDKYVLRTMPDPALAVAYGERFAALLSAEFHGIAREKLTRFQLRGTKTICKESAEAKTQSGCNKGE